MLSVTSFYILISLFGSHPQIEPSDISRQCIVSLNETTRREFANLASVTFDYLPDMKKMSTSEAATVSRALSLAICLMA